MKTVVGLYEEITDAQLAINELVRAGFDRANISLVATNRWADETTAMTPSTDDGDDAMENPNPHRSAVAGCPPRVHVTTQWGMMVQSVTPVTTC
mgnify:CR=1 FL=1